MIAVAVALVAGKPLGIVSVSWLMVRLGWCVLPAEVNWRSIMLVGLLAGIGFTMSIFIANLAFVDPGSLGAAKLGVLSASLIAAVLGLTWGCGACAAQRLLPKPVRPPSQFRTGDPLQLGKRIATPGAATTCVG